MKAFSVLRTVRLRELALDICITSASTTKISTGTGQSEVYSKYVRSKSSEIPCIKGTLACPNKSREHQIHFAQAGFRTKSRRQPVSQQPYQKHPCSTSGPEQAHSSQLTAPNIQHSSRLLLASPRLSSPLL
jgi:hypothetical protein